MLYIASIFKYNRFSFYLFGDECVFMITRPISGHFELPWSQKVIGVWKPWISDACNCKCLSCKALVQVFYQITYIQSVITYKSCWEISLAYFPQRNIFAHNLNEFTHNLNTNSTVTRIFFLFILHFYFHSLISSGKRYKKYK